MNKICPKCGYARQETDVAPDWQCPSCEVAYNKAGGADEGAHYGRYNVMETQAPRKSSAQTILKLAVCALIIIGAFSILKPEHRSAKSVSTVSASSVTGQPVVILYGTSWCGYCRKTREFFRSQGIQFTDYDVEHDTEGAQQYRELGGGGVPIIKVGDQIIHGFDEEALRDELKNWLKQSET